jgi:hypothetical protein
MKSVLVLIALAACGGDDGTGGVAYEYRTCDVAEHVGSFRVDLAEDFTGVQGRVEDGVAPLEVPDLVASSGDCAVWRSPELFCDPACDVSTTCAQDGSCVPLPVRLSAGAVTITGLAAAVDMPPREPDFFYTNPGTLPHPGFAPGADIQLAASGSDDVAAFALAGRGVEPLAGAPDELVVAEGEPLAIGWREPDDDDAGARALVLLDFAQHGGPHIFIECDVPDTGAASVPAELVQELLDSEVSGFPGAVLTRRTVSAADLAAGCVDFQVATQVEIPVEVPGVISCTDDEPCPEPRTCQTDLTCG